MTMYNPFFPEDLPHPVALIDTTIQFRHIDGVLFARIMIENLCKKYPIYFRFQTAPNSKMRIQHYYGILEANGTTSIHVDVSRGFDPDVLRTADFSVIHAFVIPIPPNYRCPEQPFVRLRGNPMYANAVKRLCRELRENGLSYENHTIACMIEEDVIRGFNAAAAASSLNRRCSRCYRRIGDLFTGSNSSSEEGSEINTEDNHQEMRQLEMTVLAWVDQTAQLREKVASIETMIWVGICITLFTFALFSITNSYNYNGRGIKLFNRENLQFQVLVNDSHGVMGSAENLYALFQALAKQFSSSQSQPQSPEFQF